MWDRVTQGLEQCVRVPPASRTACLSRLGTETALSGLGWTQRSAAAAAGLRRPGARPPGPSWGRLTRDCLLRPGARDGARPRMLSSALRAPPRWKGCETLQRGWTDRLPASGPLTSFSQSSCRRVFRVTLCADVGVPGPTTGEGHALPEASAPHKVPLTLSRPRLPPAPISVPENQLRRLLSTSRREGSRAAHCSRRTLTCIR